MYAVLAVKRCIENSTSICKIADVDAASVVYGMGEGGSDVGEHVRQLPRRE